MDNPVNVPLKRCCHCKQLLPPTSAHFFSDKKMTDGLNRRCKTCCREYYRSKHPIESIHQPPPDGYIKCSTCQKILPATTEYFYSQRNATSKYKLAFKCKECSRTTDRHTIPLGYKRCKGCKKILPATREYFTLSSTEKYGLGGMCAECRKGLNAKRAHSGIYPPNGATKRCGTCKESFPATLEYFQSDASKPDHLCSRCKQCANASRHNDRARASIRIIARNRKARKKAIPGKLTTQDIKEQYKRQKGKCYYCSKKTGDDYEIDHIVPITRAGSTNDKWNIVIACPHCNSSKRNRLPHEWPEGNRLL